MISEHVLVVVRVPQKELAIPDEHFPRCVCLSPLCVCVRVYRWLCVWLCVWLCAHALLSLVCLTHT